MSKCSLFAKRKFVMTGVLTGIIVTNAQTHSPKLTQYFSTNDISLLFDIFFHFQLRNHYSSANFPSKENLLWQVFWPGVIVTNAQRTDALAKNDTIFHTLMIFSSFFDTFFHFQLRNNYSSANFPCQLHKNIVFVYANPCQHQFLTPHCFFSHIRPTSNPVLRILSSPGKLIILLSLNITKLPRFWL